MLNSKILGVFTFLCIVTLTIAANSDRSSVNNDRYNPYYQDPYHNSRDYYSNRYYKNNRDYYSNRQYYDRNFKNYNRDIAPAQARIVDSDVKAPENGYYSYSYDTENGIHADEHGVPIRTGIDSSKEVVQGSYSFVTPEGLHVVVRYTADENGYHPVITYGGVDADKFAYRAQPADVVVTKAN